MEGKFFIKNLDAPKEKHEHIVFTLDNNISLDIMILENLAEWHY